MKRNFTKEELIENKRAWRIISIVVTALFVVSIFIYEGRIEDLKLDTNDYQDNYDFEVIIYKSCSIGCIKSIKFYNDNSNIYFNESISECLNYCLEVSYKIDSSLQKKDSQE